MAGTRRMTFDGGPVTSFEVIGFYQTKKDGNGRGAT
jgi:hypothetical protein